jgi:hypothetical protein
MAVAGLGATGVGGRGLAARGGAMIRQYGLPGHIQVLSRFDADSSIKGHASYLQAKAGDPKAALDLISDLALAWPLGMQGRFSSSCTFAAPHAKEVSGDNALAQTLAAVCALVHSGKADTSVVQTDRVFHTGAGPMERMATRAEFEGEVVAGKRYVLVDDVISMGGTLAELSNFIQSRGGLVHDVVVLTNAGSNKSLVPDAKTVRLLKERFHHDTVKFFGIEPGALSANDASYLVGFRSVDEIRNRLAKAEQEIDNRLRSKGVSRAVQGRAG